MARIRQTAFAGRFVTKRASKQKQTTSPEAGFTLVELLVVLAIISLIAGMVGPRVLNYLSDSKTKAARIQMESLKAAIDLYYLDNGSYPPATTGLNALVKKPDGTSHWNGPYLKGTVVPNDPWGQTYSYIYPGQHGEPYDLISFGSDGREGGTDSAADVVSWQR